MKTFFLAVAFLLTTVASAQLSNNTLLDTSYNHVGYRISPDLYLIGNELYCSDVDSEGRIINVYTEEYSEDMFISRYDNNGQLDTTFGNNGVIILLKSNFDSLFTTNFELRLMDIKSLNNGKIIIAGHDWGKITNFITYDKAILIQLNEDGTFDTTFGSNGAAIIDNIDQYYSSRFTKIKLDSDGKILLLGGVAIDHSWPYFSTIFRYNSNGTLDTTFNYVGYIILSEITPKSILIHSNGDILAPYIREEIHDTLEVFSMLKFDASGDSISSTDIFNITDESVSGTHGTIADIISDYSDNIYVSTHAYGHGPNYDTLALFKINPQLQLDLTFCNSGIVFYNNSPHGFSKRGINITPNGSVFSATNVYLPYWDSLGVIQYQSSILIIKYTNTGLVDNTFGDNGKYYIHAPFPNRFLPNTTIIKPYFVPSENKVFVRSDIFMEAPFGTVGKYNFFVAKLLNDTAKIILDIIDNPTTTSSITAYPNPIQNSTINLSYELANKQDISIDLYDIKGQLITSLLTKQPRQKGNNNEVLNLPTTLASGQYIIRVVAGAFQKGISVIVE